MEPPPPQPDWAFEQEWHWPAWKFGMAMDELFTTLHSQFNTWAAPMQSFEAFKHDVWEISNAATTRDDFFQALEMRKKQRSEEMARVWDMMACYMTAGQSILPDDHWEQAIRFFRTRSLDNMLAFLYQFLNEEEKEKVTWWNAKLGRLHGDQEKDKKEEKEPLAASIGIDGDVDVNNTPASWTTPRPLKRKRDQPSPIDNDGYYRCHHCKREYKNDHNTTITPPPTNDNNHVSASPTGIPCLPTPPGKETHTVTVTPPLIIVSSTCSSSSLSSPNKVLTSYGLDPIQTKLNQHSSSQANACPPTTHSSTPSPSSPAPPLSSPSPLLATAKSTNTGFSSRHRQREVRQALKSQKQRRRLQLSHNSNRITKRGRRMVTRGKSKVSRPRPKLKTDTQERESR
ncbi:hypothetical protein F4802DRAFT_104445 [Xylaria palmicola]|nr:hypothetical protein F4802DRAFT_104445 [Xylaria palmicola]